MQRQGISGFSRTRVNTKLKNNIECSLCSDRMELALRGCVFEILEQADVGCTMDDVIEMSAHPEVRDDLLDSVSPGCGELLLLLVQFQATFIVGNDFKTVIKK